MGKAPRILIVEDELLVAEDLADSLKEAGYDVAAIVATGEEAIVETDHKKPDLVLLDILLGGAMDGIDAGQTISNRFKVPIVYLTAHTDKGILSRAKLSQPFGYLVKPFAQRDLVPTIEMALHKARIERKLRESEKNYRRLVDGANDIIYQTDHRGRLTFVNPVVLNKTGFSEMDLMGKQFVDVIHPDYVGEVQAFYLSQFENRIPETYFEMPLLTKTQDTIWIGQNVQLLTEGERAIGFQSIARDITDRKLAEDLVVVQRDLSVGLSAVSDLHEALELCIDAALKVSRMDSAGIYTVNDDRSMQLAAHKGLSDSFVKNVKNLAADSTHVRLILEGKPVYTIHNRPLEWGLDPIGRTETLKAVAVIPIAHNNRVIASFNIASKTLDEVPEWTRDALEAIALQMGSAVARIQAEERLRQTELLRAVGELASGVAHHFNNMLQIVLGGAQVALINLELSELASVKAELDRIIDSCRFGAETVKRLQSFARIRTDAGPSDRTVFDLSYIVRQALAMTKMWWKTESEQSGVLINMHEALGKDCKLEGRENELFEVAVNLIKNAVEALPHGGNIRVETSIDRDDVVFEVKDSGIGVAQENLGRIFDPFFTTKGFQTAGMGLASSHSIIQRHGGTVAVLSEEGHGTTFKIRLPRIKDLPEIAQVTSVRAARLKLNILVIDDIEPLLMMLEDGLTQFGQTVYTALSGNEGLQIFSEQPVDLVICDLAMPGMNGWEVGKKLKSVCLEQGVEKVPFVLLTGWGGQAYEGAKIAESGVDAIVEKPVDIQRLLGTIRGIALDRESNGVHSS